MTSPNLVPTAGANNTSAWLSFTYVQFGAAAFMAGLGLGKGGHRLGLPAASKFEDCIRRDRVVTWNPAVRFHGVAPHALLHDGRGRRRFQCVRERVTSAMPAIKHLCSSHRVGEHEVDGDLPDRDLS